MPTTNVIDVYHGDSINLEKLKGEGIIAIIHKATEGINFRDPMYAERKSAAKEAGFLWGAYHFATAADWEDQVNHFLDTCQPATNEFIAWDWEVPPRHRPPMTLANVRDSVQLIHERLGRFPLIYGGSLLREQIGNREDPVLKNCPLWYARYRSSPVGVPQNTWPTYTLWQYTAAEIPFPGTNPPGPLEAGGQRVDRNLYQGTDEDLIAKWPLS